MLLFCEENEFEQALRVISGSYALLIYIPKLSLFLNLPIKGLF